MDVLLYTRRDGCVTEVNEQRVRANTQGAQGTLASWRCSALQGPPLGAHRERERERDPEPPPLGSRSSYFRSSMDAQPWLVAPAKSPGAERQGWSSLGFPASLFLGLAVLRPAVPGIGASHLSVFLDMAHLCSVQLPRWQTHLPKVELRRANLYQPAPVHGQWRYPHLTCLALRLSGGQSLLFQCLLSISLHLCPPPPVSLLGPHLCLFVPLPLPVTMAQIELISLWIHL